jgi:hypothetical protein
MLPQEPLHALRPEAYGRIGRPDNVDEEAGNEPALGMNVHSRPILKRRAECS